MRASALLIIPVAVFLLIFAVWLRGLVVRALSRGRLLEEAAREEPTEATEAGSEEPGSLGRWLALAGYRSPQAPAIFVGTTVGMAIVGTIALLLVQRSGVMTLVARGVEAIPGDVGEIFMPAVVGGPWIILLILLCTPWLMVRSSRRQIVNEVEQDLPLVLELLATLSEAGLGFDAAIERVVSAQPVERPLTTELRGFQRETLSGRPRVEALRRMSRRLEVPSLTIFISAVVQAEQIGSGISDVFRRQAEDSRDRRRDRALNLAQSLPVKLLFPLVICFLPAIFVITLGPVFLQFFKLAESLMSRGRLR